MEDFRALEAAFKRTPVRVSGAPDISGVLRLRGGKTSLRLSSSKFFHYDGSAEDGWFNLTVRSADGRELYLYHAITTASAQHHWGEGAEVAHTMTVYPNFVFDNVRGLDEDHRVRSIAFKMEGLEHFFSYRNTELLNAFDLSAAQNEALRSMRFHADQEDGPFDPQEVYVVHRLPTYLDFAVADRRYRVWTSGRFTGGGMHRISAVTAPTAEIQFDAPMELDDALDRLWEWRRFFTQMALEQLPFRAITVRGSQGMKGPSANAYLPNSKRNPRTAKGIYELKPRRLALNSWAERQQLADAMKCWLEREDSRSTFRARLDRVIARMHKRVDPSDLLDLASAVDSLSELAAASPLPRDVLSRMAMSAFDAASSVEGVTIERITGLLGGLQRPSLTTRFTALGTKLTPPLASTDAELLARASAKIRNASAHGGAMDDQSLPRVRPTIEAMTALCARFDLETCGVPARTAHDAQSVPKWRFEEAMQNLKLVQRPS